MKEEIIILGAGVTGLAAGIKTGFPLYEASSYPGGICRSYSKKGYHFETGGGHWIFGTDKTTLDFINALSPLKKYQRRSAVYFPEKDLYVPYPLQNHLSYFPKEIAKKALGEMTKKSNKITAPVTTFADWLEINFGKTLCQLFFFPFQRLYTAGLYTRIAPQDRSKNPINKNLTAEEAKGKKAIRIGYNKTFVYPKKGLTDLIEKMAQKCQINYKKEVVRLDTKKKEIFFKDGSKLKYKKIISTLPLNKMIKIARINLNEPFPPYTSTLVINIGAKKSSKYPNHHWLYIPKSKSSFHRIGSYSNIDSLFLPLPKKNKISFYIDKAYLGGNKPSKKEIDKLCQNVIRELQEWKFINEVEVVDSTWIETAYTWSWPNSQWKEKALKILKENDIYQIGRYGKWQFQGILESIKEGLSFPKHLLF